MSRERELFALLEPCVASQGLSLVEVSLGSRGGGALVRIVIHSGHGVSHADCARVTRACDEVLEEGPFPGGGYVLEVSSPGIDRVLKEEREFDLFRGLAVRLRLEGEPSERTGVCAGTRGGEGVVLRDDDGRESVIPWSRVAKARLVPAERRSGGFGGKGR